MKSALSVLIMLVGGTVAQVPGDLDTIRVDGKPCGLVGKPGGSPPQQALNKYKNRYAIPAESDIDPEVSLAALVAPGIDVNRFSPKNAAQIRAFVIEIKEGEKESCNCEATDPVLMDTHIVLGAADGVPETQHVIVEVTPRLRMLKKAAGKDWSTATLKHDYSKKWVEVTGWLTFDTAHIKQAENTHHGNPHNWRATCWEIHPVTEITLLDGPPPELKNFQHQALTALQSLHAAHVQRSPKGPATITKLHDEQLTGFTDEEKREAEEEAKANLKRP
jgi:hypothetical protein